MARLRAEAFDAAILDVMLPEMDGFAWFGFADAPRHTGSASYNARVPGTSRSAAATRSASGVGGTPVAVIDCIELTTDTTRSGVSRHVSMLSCSRPS